MSSAAATPSRNPLLLSEQDRIRAHDTSALGGTALLTGPAQRIRLLPIVGRQEPALVTFEIERPVGIELPPWAQPAIQSLYELLAMEGGWDSYAGAAISHASARSAFAFLADVMQDTTPLPSFVPTTNGGIQLEWHFDAGDIEVDFDPSEGTSAYFSDVHSEAEYEGSAGQLKSRIAQALSQIA